MSLLKIYKNKNQDVDWFEDHFSLSKGKAGRMFEYVNTNFRKQNSFIEHFLTFQEVEDLPRKEWIKQNNHGQEKHKHMVVNMIQSKLFRKNKDNLFSRTVKGELYTDFIEEKNEEAERWFLNYLFLVNGYYLSQKNYIIHRVREDLRRYILSIDNVDEDFLINSVKELLNKKTFEEILRSDFFYIHSFYNDSDFLINYLRASKEEKEELAKYIENNLKNKTYECCISKKYQLSGNFNKSMLKDEAKVFLLTLLFIKTKNINLDNANYILVNLFHNSVNSINKNKVLKYLDLNKNIFNPIFSEILEIETEAAEDVIIDTEDIASDKEDLPEKYIDDTSEEGKQQIKATFNLRKKQARIQNNYKCCLETANNCNSIYFTSKSTGKTYVELHHFIPREFRNDFSQSIEVLANYVTLCPRCHRQIHLATDRERKFLINSLFKERKERLNIVGLNLDLNKVYEYYKIIS